MKNVQISEELFVKIARYFLLNEHNADTYNAIRKGVETKLDALIKHNLYTAYKTAETTKEQEQARQEYLDKAGIPDSFRW